MERSQFADRRRDGCDNKNENGVYNINRVRRRENKTIRGAPQRSRRRTYI